MGLLDNLGEGLKYEILRWCKETGIKNFSIKNNEIYINGDLPVSYNIEYPIRWVKGNVKVYSGCDSLENFPQHIGKSLTIHSCDLKTIEYEGVVVERIDILRCENVESINVINNRKNWLIKVSCCDKLKELNIKSPETDFIQIAYNKELENINRLPKKIKDLEVVDCPKLHHTETMNCSIIERCRYNIQHIYKY